LADLGFKVFVENQEVLVLMVPRENKGQKVFLDTKVHLVSWDCQEREAYQVLKDIKEEEETPEDQVLKDPPASKASEDYRESAVQLDHQVSRVMQVIQDLLVLQESPEQQE
jgi:hypothetical protein